MIKPFVASLFIATAALAQTPSTTPANLVAEGVPAFSQELIAQTRPYMDNRSAFFTSWHPALPQMLISTRFAETPQLHLVKMPGGDRKQLTFYPEPVSGRFLHHDPNTIIFSKDIGGNEQFQLYRFDLASGSTTLLTDGKSRNTDGIASRDGKWIAYASTRRSGNDTDIWVEDPKHPEGARMLLQVEGGGWRARDLSPDDSQMLVMNDISANESYIWLVDMKSGEKKLLTPKGATPVSYGNVSFAADGKSIYYTSDERGEFAQLIRMKLADASKTVINPEPWDVDDVAFSDDGKRLAYTTNENGIGVLHVVDLATNKPLALPKVPFGTIVGPSWHSNGHLLGFSLVSAKSPLDAYSIDVDTRELQRWTESETGGLDSNRNVEPQLVTLKSFDGKQISAFIYRPDPARWPGKRPVLMNIHGGPEGQARPGFLGRSNYWVNELGIAIVYPNVRGSSGYGKSYLASDDGFKREDTVKDIGAIIDWIKSDPALDGSRIGVYGGSYGGYMSLATMTHYNDQMRAGIDLVGISNFLTFLKNTSGYRRDLRRVEYGDERDPKMNAFLQQISPLSSASKITKPLFVIAGFNDPRVPWTEGQQVVTTVRANGGPVWWLMAKDEGHGFQKKPNVDYQFLAMTEFLDEYLVK